MFYLNLKDYTSIDSFVGELAAQKLKVDYFIANAGVVQGRVQVWGFTVDPSSNVVMYVDGKIDKTISSQVGTTFALVNPAVIFNDAERATTAFNGGINGAVPFFAVWNRVLTAGEIAQITNDPYCLLIFPQERPSVIVPPDLVIGGARSQKRIARNPLAYPGGSE